MNLKKSTQSYATLSLASINWYGQDMTMTNDNDNDNDNMLFDHNIQIEIIVYNSLENQIINWSGDYY